MQLVYTTNNHLKSQEIRSKSNQKKVFCKTGLELDCTSVSRKNGYAYVKNTPGIRKFVKKTMNKRMRRLSRYLERDVSVKHYQDID